MKKKKREDKVCYYVKIGMDYDNKPISIDWDESYDFNLFIFRDADSEDIRQDIIDFLIEQQKEVKRRRKNAEGGKK